MKPYCVYLLSLIGLLTVLGAEAQVEYYHIPIPRNPLNIDYTPFGSVQVLDERPDTTRLYTIQSGRYPPLSITLDTSLETAVKNYLDTVMSGINQGNRHLLIRIEYLSNPNIYPMRFFVFEATAYVERTDGTYMRLIHVQKLYKRYHMVPVSAIAEMCGELIEASGIAYARLGGPAVPYNATVAGMMRDTAAFACARPGPGLPFSAIDADYRDKWEQYPILQANHLVAGEYRTFHAFRNNQIHVQPIRMHFEAKDSLFVKEGNHTNKADRHDWAVSDGRDLYKRLRGNEYVLLERDQRGLYFYVPRSLPDMYALLTRFTDLGYAPQSEVRYTGSAISGPLFIPSGGGHGHGGGGKGGGSDVNAGVVLLVVGGLIVVGVTAYIVSQEVKKRAAIRRGIVGDYRLCTVDMDTGDILYAKDAYPLRP